ncbi:expressed protein [Phakopsora pachyrhizi]|uniref:Expressed protein n=1 Tax=Phakopsora pachyrhizi TaxID=170000 RepID=A0AAV0B798_PHAPC|nr:expressed protein [Phakopsora pachyrhizi]CAH7681286.1 expressed protein [Phakopsora pachyrhizi]
MKVLNLEFFRLMTIILLHCALEGRAADVNSVQPALYLDCEGADVTDSCNDVIDKYTKQTNNFLVFRPEEDNFEDPETSCRIRWWMENFEDPNRISPKEFSLNKERMAGIREQMSNFCKESGVIKTNNAIFPSNVTYFGKINYGSPYIAFQIGKTRA